MQTIKRRKSLQYGGSSLLAVGLIVMLASWQQIAADSKSDEKQQTTNVDDLSSVVDTNVPQQLRVAGKHRYSVKVSLTLKDKLKPVSGPIYLVVQGTGIDTLAADKADGFTSDDEPYVLMLSPSQKLSAVKPMVSQEISFQSDSALRSTTRREFNLEYRLTREISQPEFDVVEPRTPRTGSTAKLPGIGGRTSSTRGTDTDTDKKGSQPKAQSPTEVGETKPGESEREPFTLKPNIDDEELKRVIALQDKSTPELIKKSGVIGTATGVNVDGDLVIRVYTSRLGIDKDLPESLGGIAIEPKVVGRFRTSFQAPQDKRGRAGFPGQPSIGGGFLATPEVPEVEDPQKFFPRPVPIGVSGFNLTFNGCAAGTIGCRLIGEDGTLYALSNNHVFADENDAPIGDPILQPAPADDDLAINCAPNTANTIGRLAAFIPLNFATGSSNTVDAAIAIVTAGTLDRRTPEGAYGTPNSSTVAPSLGMKVQKMGRTTGFTSSRVTAINASSFVGYSNGLAFFVGQIEFTKPLLVDDGMGNITVVFDEFGAGGDSGSLIVTTGGKNPVGLLFAGSVFTVLGNPIDNVLDQLSDEIGQSLSIDGSRPNNRR